MTTRPYLVYPLLTFIVLLSACTTTKEPRFYTPEGYAAHLAEQKKLAPAEDGISREQFMQMLALAEKGDATAQYHLGMFYHMGMVAAKDKERAFDWFQKSAQQKNPLASYKVGCYYSGQGKEFMPVDDTKALEYKRVAAEAGYSLAQYDTGMLLLGRNDVDGGIQWLKLAGMQGDLQSLNMLFTLYYLGKKVPQDLPLAYLYLKMAMKTATDEAPQAIQMMLKDLQQRVPKAEQDEADKTVSQWEAKPTALTLEARRGMQAAEDYLK